MTLKFDFLGNSDSDLERKAPVDAEETATEETIADTQTETSESTEGGGKSRLVTVLQGAAVFVVMFVVLWVGLSRLLGDEQE